VNASADFSKAVARFKDFLAANGYPPSLVWVRPDDVLFAGTKQVFLRIPSPSGNEQHAQDDFETGTKRQIGVLFATLCQMNATTYCYTWVPANEEESERHLMPRDVKFSATIGKSVLEANAVPNHITWLWLKLKHRKHQEFKKELFLG
jgi:hypothetical protein